MARQSTPLFRDCIDGRLQSEDLLTERVSLGAKVFNVLLHRGDEQVYFGVAGYRF